MLLLNARLATQLDTNMNNTWSLVDKIKRGLLPWFLYPIQMQSLKKFVEVSPPLITLLNLKFSFLTINLIVEDNRFQYWDFGFDSLLYVSRYSEIL